MELAHYFATSPNSNVAGCLNTGASGDGVVFPGVEVLRGEHCFIGRESIIEAVAGITALKPGEVRRRLETPDTSKKTIADLEARVADLEAQIERWEAYAEAARDVGIGVPTIE